MDDDRKLAKQYLVRRAEVIPLHIAEFDENFGLGRGDGCFGLHNDVDIKMGIIYKNCNFAQKHWIFNRFWSIVLKQSA